MTARSEILVAARQLADASPDGTFSPGDVIERLAAEGSRYPASTIRTHVTSLMCGDAPDNHGTTYNDLVRVHRGRYRLREQSRTLEPPEAPRLFSLPAVGAILSKTTLVPQRAFDALRRAASSRAASPAPLAPRSDAGIPSENERLTEHVAEIMADLAQSRPVFHSEADFQHALAWTIHTRYPEARVRLETRPAAGVHLDMLVTNGSDVTSIELKYLTRKWQGSVNDEAFHLADHGAQDIRGYDCVKDITRIEKFVSVTKGSRGLVIVLTNDPHYWRTPVSSRTTNAEDFRLHEGALVSGLRAWGPLTGGTRFKREDALSVTGHYVCRWSDYSLLPDQGGQLRYMAIAVPGADELGDSEPTDPIPTKTATPPSTTTIRIGPVSDTRTAGAQALRRWLEDEGWSVKDETAGRRKVFVAHRNGVRRVIRYTSRSSGDFQLSTANNHIPLGREDHYWAFVDLTRRDPSITIVLEDDARAFFKTEHENYLARHGGRRPRNDKSEHQGLTDTQMNRLLRTARRW